MGRVRLTGASTFLFYVVGVGDVYRDSQPLAFMPLVLFCLIFGAAVAWGGGNVLRRRRG